MKPRDYKSPGKREAFSLSPRAGSEPERGAVASTLVALLALLTLASLYVLLVTHSNKPAPSTADCCAPESSVANAGPKRSDDSIYQLESVWTNDHGTIIHLADLAGTIQITTLFFASCEFACPALVSDMKRIEQSLPPEARNKVKFLLISFDTERDTPAALHAYRARMSLPDDRWTLLHGRADDVLEVAALLGVKFKKDARGQFAHSNIITVLGDKGQILHQQIGLNLDPLATVTAVSNALKSTAKPN